MKRSIRVVLSMAMLAGTVMGTATAASGSPPTSYYLALGDSLSVGFQPTLKFGHGYADQLHAELSEEIPGLELVKRGCPGDSTDTMIRGFNPLCPYRPRPQLDVAVDFLRAHRGAVKLITIDIGFNDVGGTDGVQCWDIRTGVFDKECVEGELPNIQSNLASIIDTLRAAAPGVPIAGMSFHDPFVAYWVLGPRWELIARYNERTMQSLNTALVSTYQSTGVIVADVAGPDYFDNANFTDMVWTEHFGLIPVTVAHACGWTWFCRPRSLFDQHPNATGYGVMARAFEDALRP